MRFRDGALNLLLDVLFHVGVMDQSRLMVHLNRRVFPQIVAKTVLDPEEVLNECIMLKMNNC